MHDRSELFLRLVRTDPANPLFRFSLGQALLSEGREDEAVEHLRLAASSKADWMVPRILLGKCLLRLAAPAEAKGVLQEALQLAVAQGHEEPEAELRALLAGL